MMAERHVLGISGGKDSAALAVFMRLNHPELDIDYFFTDTGKELPEVYEFLAKLEGFLGKSIQKLNPDRDFDFWLREYGHFLPSPRTRWCTRQLKLVPFRNWIKPWLEAGDAVHSLIGADADDIVLTSSATESNNLALLGYLRHRKGTSCLIHSAIEHKCVIEAGYALRDEGCTVAVVPTDGLGRISLKAICEAREATDRQNVLVSLMHANNELGTVTPLSQIAAAIGSDAVLHTDAAQSVGRIPFDVSELQVDVVTMSSHKIGGPSGIAALYIAP
jgi:hypothetical protein